MKQAPSFKQSQYDKALIESFLKIDEELEKDTGKEELAKMKRANPASKSPLFKILGSLNGKGDDGGE